MGIAVEQVFGDVIRDFRSDLADIRPKNKKGNKERDHLFADHVAKIVYYAEIKTNLNLDTEKSVSTRTKCVQIEEELKTQYPDYEIKMFLVGARYLTQNQISNTVMGKYKAIGTNVVGVNEYFSNLGIEYQFHDDEEYHQFVNHIADYMFTER